MMKKTHDTKKKKMKIAVRYPLPPFKDWKNEDEYKYMDNHTPELWAWEFLRRNPEYQKDWNDTLKMFKKDGHPTEKLPFKGARAKWGLYFDEIINPNLDKPPILYPYSLFWSYYFFTKDELNSFRDLKKNEVVIVIDFGQRIQPQLEYYKVILEDYQKDQAAYSDLEVDGFSNKKIYWKDYIRILDARDNKADNKEIASVIFPRITNKHPNYNGNDRVRDSYDAAINIRDKDYRKILQKACELKKR